MYGTVLCFIVAWYIVLYCMVIVLCYVMSCDVFFFVWGGGVLHIVLSYILLYDAVLPLSMLYINTKLYYVV